MSYRMITTRGNVYTLADDGRVLACSNGPKGWDYSGKWVIVGFTKRHHSRAVLPLDAVLKGGDVGQGWVHDLDHGTRRVWGTERLRSLVKIADDPSDKERN